MKYILAAVMAVFLASCGTVPELGNDDASCDYNEGTIVNGVSTCYMDETMEVHGFTEKNLHTSCVNGLIVDADITTSDKDCLAPVNGAQSSYKDCLEKMTNTECSIKFKNGCATNHHTDTKSLSCIPPDTLLLQRAHW